MVGAKESPPGSIEKTNFSISEDFFLLCGDPLLTPCLHLSLKVTFPVQLGRVVLRL